MYNLIKNMASTGLLDDFPEIIALHDTDYRIVWANKANCRKQDMALEEMVGRRCYEIKGYSSPCGDCPFDEVIRYGKTCRAEVLEDEKESPLKEHNSWSLIISPVIDDAGKTIGVLKVVRDITDIKRTRDRLRKEEEFVKDVVDNSKDLIWASDRNGFIVYANPALGEILGYSLEEISSKPFNSFLHPEDQEMMKKLLPELRADKKGWNSLKIRWKHKDGSWRIIESTSTPVIDSRGVVVAYRGIDRDITERDQMAAQLAQAQKMESIGRLAGGVAHDFNNMLGVILGYSELAGKVVEPASPVSSYLEQIQQAAERSAGLTRQLLAFARKQVVNPKVLDLDITLENMLKMIRRLIGSDITLTWNPGDNLWPIEIDPGQVDQILANLCVNARDAIDGIGKITIKTENIRVTKSRSAKLPGFLPGDYVLLSVLDTGQGIDKEIIGHIFEPFFTTKSRSEGTGLGLATVYGIIKQNNGYVYARNNPRGGSRFDVYLPRYFGRCNDSGELNQFPVSLTGCEDILLVDDERAYLEIADLLLKDLGYKVTAESSPKKALEIVRQNPGKFSLLVTDMIMPEKGGRVLKDEIRKMNAGIKCLFISGHGADDSPARIKIEANEHFLQKPFSQKELAVKVRKVLDSQ